MIRNETSIIIHRPIADVFDYLSDLLNGPQWQSGLLEVRRITGGPLGVGTRFISVRRNMGRRMESGVEFTAFDLNRKIALRSFSGNSPFRQTLLFETVPDGTQVCSTFELEIRGFMSLAEPLVASSVRREMRADFDCLKDKLEARVAEAFELLE